MATTPEILAADITSSGNIAETPHPISYPAYVSGDLLIFHHAIDFNTTITVPTGPQGETAVNIIVNQGTGLNAGPRASVWYYIGAATDAGGTLNVTPSATEEWVGSVALLTAGKFNAGDVVDSSVGQGETATDITAASPALSTTSAAEDALVVHWIGVDTNEISSGPAGWTIRDNNSGFSFVNGALTTRDTAATASETVASADWTLDVGDSKSHIVYALTAYVAGLSLFHAANRGINRGVNRGFVG